MESMDHAYDLLGNLNAISSRIMDDEDLEYEGTAVDVASAILRIVMELILTNDEESEKLSNWEDKSRAAICNEIVGSHDWIPDMCGYWGHQFCSRCQEPRYPVLRRLSCAGARKLTNDATEDEYVRWQDINPDYLPTKCGDCKQIMTLVRPGKHQCDNPQCKRNP